MYDNLKPFIVVLMFSLVVFRIAKPICVRFMEARDFDRRRNVWLALTALEFFSPDFWFFAIPALILVYWAGSVERHPTALYALLLVCIPPSELPIPLPLVNQLFGLSSTRIIALALVVPACIRLGKSSVAPNFGGVRVDWILLSYGALQLVLYADFESFTNTLRRAVLFGIDIYALYFMFSRGGADKRALKDTFACLWLTAALQVPVVVFETAKGWLIYTAVVDHWGMPNSFAWLMRGEALRAQGAAGHSLTMGFMLAMGFGAWLYLGRCVQSKRTVLLVGLGMWAGLIATYARAPWIVAAVTFIAYSFFAPDAVKNLAKNMLLAGLALSVLLVTPFGEKILALLPFVGTSDQDNVSYRQELATVSWRLIKEHPWFGNPFALGEMEDLRQGQGIIDLVNTFASVALFYGGVGVTLFTACFVYPFVRCFMAARRSLKEDPEWAGVGAALVACSLGVLLMMSTASFGDAFAGTAWMMAGLCTAFSHTSSSAPRAVLNRFGKPIRYSAFL